MIYLGYVLMIVMSLGYFGLLSMKSIANSEFEEIKNLKIDESEHDKMKMAYEAFENQNISGKLATILMMGGSMFSDLFISLISLLFKRKREN